MKTTFEDILSVLILVLLAATVFMGINTAVDKLGVMLGFKTQAFTAEEVVVASMIGYNTAILQADANLRNGAPFPILEGDARAHILSIASNAPASLRPAFDFWISKLP